MANVPFSALYDQILPYLPGATEPIVDSQIRKVVREFMKRTTILRETFQFNTVAGTATYQLNPTFGQVSSVLDAFIDSEQRPLGVSTEESRGPRPAEKPQAWYTMVPHLFTLWPTPDAAYQITLNAVVSLGQTDTEIPEDIVKQYAETLAAGVLAMMFAMPGKPWTQAQAATSSGRMYHGMINTIRASLRDGGQPNQSVFRGIAKFGV